MKTRPTTKRIAKVHAHSSSNPSREQVSTALQALANRPGRQLKRTAERVLERYLIADLTTSPLSFSGGTGVSSGITLAQPTVSYPTYTYTRSV